MEATTGVETTQDTETADLFETAQKVKSGVQVQLTATAVQDEKKGAAASAEDDETKKSITSEKVEIDPIKLQAQVDGLKKELARTRPKADDMAAMRLQVAELEGRIKQATETKKAPETTPVYTDAQLSQFQDEWEAVGRQARDGDGTATLGDGRMVTTAQVRHQLDLIETEKALRRVTRANEAVTIKAESEALIAEAASLIEEGKALLPDLQNKESALFKAANAEYLKRAKFMKALGPYADLVAVSLAVTKHPELLGQGITDTKARATLLKEIEKTAESALTKGGGSAELKSTLNFSSMKASDILAFAEKVKEGQVTIQ